MLEKFGVRFRCYRSKGSYSTVRVRNRDIFS